MRTHLLAFAGLLPALLPSTNLHAQERVPGDNWERFTDPAQAGFDPQLLGQAKRQWERMDSSAFLVIAGGAVVASWGDVERRFMCHSVRKSFLSGLYGIYWDRGDIELNKTLADLNIDDQPSALLESEKSARILDLLKARSGVFHPAAYAGRTDSRPRGSEGPGRYFAYNNWDFNTLATILEQETGDSVFEAFDEHFGLPLQMQDWRVSDGYFHYERDKSKYPAYPFRLSARDAARFGLLFARGGLWGTERILSDHWVNRSSALYSIDSDIMGYGFMWWVFREPRFVKHGMYSALGVGNQMIAVLPEIDLVIVNRANTYSGERTAMEPLLNLIESILTARIGEPTANPELTEIGSMPLSAGITKAPSSDLQDYVGTWDYPPPGFEGSRRTTLQLSAEDGHLRGSSPISGSFALYLQPDGSFLEEDSHRPYLVARGTDGKFKGLYSPDLVLGSFCDALLEDDFELASKLLNDAHGEEVVSIRVMHSLILFLEEDPVLAERELRDLAKGTAEVEAVLERIRRNLLEAGEMFMAEPITRLNTRLNANSPSAWTALADLCRETGNREEEEECRERARKLLER